MTTQSALRRSRQAKRTLRSRGRALALLAALLAVEGLVAAAAFAQDAGDSSSASAAADRAVRQYLSANGLLQRGMNELAAAEYRKFLQQNPDHEKARVARYGLGVALLRMNQPQEALAELSKLQDLKDFEFAADVRFIRGQCKLNAEEFADAAAELDDLLRDSVGHALADDAAALLAEALYRGGRHADVARPCDLLAARWPESQHRPRAELFRGMALMAQDRFEPAAEVFTRLQPQVSQTPLAPHVALLRAQSLHRSGAKEDALRQYEAAVEQADGDIAAESLFGLATLLRELDRIDDSAAILDRFLERHPNHPLLESALLSRGRIWFEQSKYEQAEAAFERAAALRPATRADETAYWLAKCDLRANRFGAAVQRLEQAERNHPSSELRAEMLYDRAVGLMRGGDESAAAAVLEAMRQQFPDHRLAPEAMYLHAVIEHNARRYERAAAVGQAFVQAHPKHDRAADVAYLVADSQFFGDKLPAAIASYRDALDKHPTHTNASLARLRLGTALYRTNELDQAQEALAALSRGRETADDHRAALLILGDIHFQRQRWQQAASLLADYAALGADQPSVDDALLKIGLAHARMSQNDQAEAAFDRLIAEFPQSAHRAQAFFERGQMRLLQDRLDEAASDLNQALAGGDERITSYALSHLASIAARRGDHQQAAQLYEQSAGAAGTPNLEAQAMFQRGQALMAAKDHRGAAAAFATLIQKHKSSPHVPEAHAQRAIALARSGEHAQALKEIEQAERRFAKELTPAVQAVMLYEKAWCQREAELDADAAQTYRTLLKSFESEAIAAHALVELAELDAAASRHREAATSLAELRKMASDPSRKVPDDVQERALYRLAVCSFELGEFEAAAQLCDEFVKRFARSKLAASAHQFGGEARFKLNSHQAAADHFQTVVSKFPDDPAFAPSLLRLGECQAALSQWSQSQATFADYLERFSDSEVWFQAQFGVGWALENQGEHDEAIKAYRLVIDRHSGPTAARAQFQLGECLFALKRFEEAAAELLKVDILYGYPEWSAAALYEAGRCFEALNRPEQAHAQYRQIREKYPETKWAQLAAQQLASRE